MQLTGAEILMECLDEQDVDTIFGYPGGTILNVYDELLNYPGIRPMRLTAMPAAPARSASVSRHRAPARPT